MNIDNIKEIEEKIADAIYVRLVEQDTVSETDGEQLSAPRRRRNGLARRFGFWRSKGRW